MMDEKETARRIRKISKKILAPQFAEAAEKDLRIAQLEVENRRFRESGMLFCDDCVHCGKINPDCTCDCLISDREIWAEAQPCEKFESKLAALIVELKRKRAKDRLYIEKMARLHDCNDCAEAAQEASAQYSADYKQIRQDAASWPDWKKKTYNANFATSKHAKKLGMQDAGKGEAE